MIAHVAGVPVEELLLLAFASGTGAGLLSARAWVASRVPFTARARRPVTGPRTSAPGRAEKSESSAIAPMPERNL
jgi:hypothetical protein